MNFVQQQKRSNRPSCLDLMHRKHPTVLVPHHSKLKFITSLRTAHMCLAGLLAVPRHLFNSLQYPPPPPHIHTQTHTSSIVHKVRMVDKEVLGILHTLNSNTGTDIGKSEKRYKYMWEYSHQAIHSKVTAHWV